MTNCQKAQNMFEQTTKINCMTFQKQCAFSSMGTLKEKYVVVSTHK